MLRTDTVKVFTTGQSEAVRLPKRPTALAAKRCASAVMQSQVMDVILSSRPDSWDGFFALYDTSEVPADFMSDADRNPWQGDVRVACEVAGGCADDRRCG